MRLRLLPLAVAAVMLAGCGSPPLSEEVFAQRMEALSGVEIAYIGVDKSTPFAPVYTATVGVDSDLSAQELQAILDELDSLRTFGRYSITEWDERPDGVHWSFDARVAADERALALALWEDAAGLPRGSAVRFDSAAQAPYVSVYWATNDNDLDAAASARAVAAFASRVAAADARAHLVVETPLVTFEGVPGDCPSLAQAVEILVAAGEAASVDATCRRIVASATGDASAVLAGASDPLRELGFELEVTSAG